MKKTISFEKKIDFPKMIGEITAISLDHNLKFIDDYNIEGNLIVSGNYKLTEASVIEEEFNYKLPTEIILTENLDKETTSIDINDFYYEIENDNTLICYIEIKIEGVEVIEIEEQEEIIEQLEDNQELPQEEIIEDINNYDISDCDGDYIVNKQEELEEIEMIEEKEKPTVTSLFENISDNEETYSTYSVYIIRENENINTILEKYNTTKEELESYNDISNINIGTKLIIPLHEQKD